ncbi:MAG: hypothetical protein EZS28_039054, partial [Streblomastix strix]
TILLQGFPVDIKLKAALSIVDKVENPSQVLLSEAGKSLATISLQRDLTQSEQKQISLSGLERMSTKMDCPPILINTGVIPDLISKLLDRRRTSEIKEIETVIEIIGNAAQYDDIDKCQLNFNQLIRIMNLLIETCERLNKSQKLQNDNNNNNNNANSRSQMMKIITKNEEVNEDLQVQTNDQSEQSQNTIEFRFQQSLIQLCSTLMKNVYFVNELWKEGEIIEKLERVSYTQEMKKEKEKQKEKEKERLRQNDLIKQGKNQNNMQLQTPDDPSSSSSSSSSETLGVSLVLCSLLSTTSSLSVLSQIYKQEQVFVQYQSKQQMILESQQQQRTIAQLLSLSIHPHPIVAGHAVFVLLMMRLRYVAPMQNQNNNPNKQNLNLDQIMYNSIQFAPRLNAIKKRYNIIDLRDQQRQQFEAAQRERGTPVIQQGKIVEMTSITPYEQKDEKYYQQLPMNELQNIQLLMQNKDVQKRLRVINIFTRLKKQQQKTLVQRLPITEEQYYDVLQWRSLPKQDQPVPKVKPKQLTKQEQMQQQQQIQQQQKLQQQEIQAKKDAKNSKIEEEEDIAFAQINSEDRIILPLLKISADGHKMKMVKVAEKQNEAILEGQNVNYYIKQKPFLTIVDVDWQNVSISNNTRDNNRIYDFIIQQIMMKNLNSEEVIIDDDKQVDINEVCKKIQKSKVD